MGRNKDFATRRQAPDAIALLRARFHVEAWDETTLPSKSMLLQKTAECHGILTEISEIADKHILRAGIVLESCFQPSRWGRHHR